MNILNIDRIKQRAWDGREEATKDAFIIDNCWEVLEHFRAMGKVFGTVRMIALDVLDVDESYIDMELELDARNVGGTETITLIIDTDDCTVVVAQTLGA